MSTFRASTILAGFLALTVPLMPLQALFLKTSRRAARHFPNWYHRQVCRLIGITIDIRGKVAESGKVLLVSNHTSWLDIPVLSAVAPVSFVAKKEVGSWPFVSWLARLQRSVFVDRTKRSASGEAAEAISARLDQGDTIVLFAEGTSSDGNRVLPFKSSLFGAVKPATGETASDVIVQFVAVVYTHHHGVPLGRADRPRVGWYGDMEMQSHAWQVLGAGPLSVTVSIGPPVPLSAFGNRKDLALSSERAVRTAVHRILRARPDGEPLEPVDPSNEARKQSPQRAGMSQKWT